MHWAMSQYFPTGGFKQKSNDIYVIDISDTSSKGYILEIGLEYKNWLINQTLVPLKYLMKI